MLAGFHLGLWSRSINTKSKKKEKAWNPLLSLIKKRINAARRFLNKGNFETDTIILLEHDF